MGRRKKEQPETEPEQVPEPEKSEADPPKLGNDIEEIFSKPNGGIKLDKNCWGKK